MSVRDDLSAPGPSSAARDAAGYARPGGTALKRDTAAETPTAPVTPVAPPEVAIAKPPRSRKNIFRLVAAAIVILVGGYYAFGYFTTGRFMVTTDDAYVQADITILAAKASGYVSSVEVENNQSLEAGQVIARLDDLDYKLAVQAAADKLATQQSAVDRIGRQTEAARAQVDMAEPMITSARADVVRTSADYDRQTRLSQSDYASKARLEQAVADRDRAGASVKGAEAGLVAARANVSVLQAQQREAERVAAEYRTALAKTERDLTFTIVRAPVSGVIGNRAVEVGSYVQPGTRLAALVPLSSVHIDANFKETQLVRIRPGMKVDIEVDAYPGREFPGTVESIAPASGSQFSLLPPENATGNFTKIVQRVPVRIKVDAATREEALLRPGLSVVVRIDTRTGPADKPAR